MDADLLLLERWRAGDRRAGEELFGRHFDDIYRFFEHKVAGEAEELSQRTFEKCVAARDQFRGASSFRTYLFTIARHELYAFFRSRLPRGEQVDLGEVSLANLSTSLGSRLQRKQEIEQLRLALCELPVEQQLLLELHHWQGLDAAALGEVFGVAAGTIRVRLLRARRALREMLASRSADGRADPSGDPLSRALSEPEAEDG